MALDLLGLPVAEALALLAKSGLEPEVVFTRPPSPAFDIAGRTLRVVAVREDRLIAAYFRDGEPEEKESLCK